jgi:glycosyltransferase involved in cell wall biosynthesis
LAKVKNTEMDQKMKKLLIFIVAYNAEKTIEAVCKRIPKEIFEISDAEILIIDDCSNDQTFTKAKTCQIKTPASAIYPYVLRNPVNLGYGGNQKVGYKYAINNNFDYVALIHGDGQYAPEMLPELFKGFLEDDADVVFGSRMLTKGGAKKGGMPFYKFIGNRILTTFQNKILGLHLSEYHTGYRLYSIEALKQVPFQLNTDDFHFDTEIIIQLSIAGKKIVEKPIPTFYGSEKCHVNGMKYALDVSKASISAYLTGLSLFYDVKYDCIAKETQHYVSKSDFDSTHQRVLDLVEDCHNILDIGCGPGHVATAIKEKGKRVTGIDQYEPENALDHFIQFNLDEGLPHIDYSQYDCILILDIIEHLKTPEAFLLALHESGITPETKLIFSTANIGFILSRISHLFGMFNYGKRGILDITHHRLFTVSSFTKLIKQTNFNIKKVSGVPVPFPLAIGNNFISKWLLILNKLLITMNKSLFSFQFIVVANSKPSLQLLLNNAKKESESDECIDMMNPIN